MADLKIGGFGGGIGLEEIRLIILALFFLSIAVNVLASPNENLIDTIGYKVLGIPECKATLNLCFAPSLDQINKNFETANNIVSKDFTSGNPLDIIKGLAESFFLVLSGIFDLIKTFVFIEILYSFIKVWLSIMYFISNF